MNSRSECSLPCYNVTHTWFMIDGEERIAIPHYGGYPACKSDSVLAHFHVSVDRIWLMHRVIFGLVIRRRRGLNAFDHFILFYYTVIPSEDDDRCEQERGLALSCHQAPTSNTRMAWEKKNDIVDGLVLLWAIACPRIFDHERILLCALPCSHFAEIFRAETEPI